MYTLRDKDRLIIAVKFLFSITDPGKSNEVIRFTLPSYIMIKMLHKLKSDVTLPLPERHVHVFDNGVKLGYRGYGKWIMYNPENEINDKLTAAYTAVVKSLNEVREEMNI